MAVEKASDYEKFDNYVAEVLEDIKRYKNESHSWRRFKSVFKLGRLISRYGLVCEASEYKQMRIFNSALYILGNTSKPLYLTAEGKFLYSDNRIYNEDHSLYVLLSASNIMAIVSSATGEIVWMYGHKVKPRILKNFYRILTFNTLSGFISDNPDPAFDGVVPENTGAAKEFFEAARNGEFKD